MILDRHQRNLCRWLDAPDPSINRRKAVKDRFAGTGQWFIGSADFEAWRDSPASFLWLHGIPGCEESILTSTIIDAVFEHCSSGPDMVCVYFFFDFNDLDKRHPEKMLRSLITQVSLQDPNPSQPLNSLYNDCDKGNRQPLHDSLLLTFKQMLRPFSEIFLVIDALDECSDREHLLQILIAIVGWDFENFHILVTSRLEQDLRTAIDNLNGHKEIRIQSQVINEDIRAYVHDRLHMDPTLQRWRRSANIQSEIETSLMEKACGM